MTENHKDTKGVDLSKKEIFWIAITTVVVVALFAIVSLLATEYEAQIRAWVGKDSMLAMVVYTAFTAGAIVIAPVSSLPLIPVASSAFGWLTAGLLYILGLTIGSYVAFGLARRPGVSLVSKVMPMERIHSLEERVPERNRFWTVVLLRMIVPVPILSYALGLFSRISHMRYLIATVIGVTPFALLFAYIGTVPVGLQIIIFFEVFLIIFVSHYFYTGTYSSKHIKKLLLAIFILIMTITLFAFRDEVIGFVRMVREASGDNMFLVAGVLIVLKTVSAPLGFPGTPLTLLAGSLLGSFWGTIVSLIGNTAGAVLAFLVARYILRDYVQDKLLAKYPKIKEFEGRIERKAFSTVVALRLIPLFPFNGLNFILGLTNISLKNYALGSFIGMIPGTFAFVFLGGSLATFSPINITLAILGIGLLIVVGKMYEKRF